MLASNRPRSRLKKVDFMANVSIKKFDKEKDKHIAHSVFPKTSDLQPLATGLKTEFGLLSPGSIEYCCSSISRLLQSIDGGIAIYLVNTGLEPHHLYPLILIIIHQIHWTPSNNCFSDQ